MKKLFLIFNLFILISCNKDAVKEKDADIKLYNKAISYMARNKFVSAADKLSKLENDHPFSEYIDESEVLLAFINYLDKDYDDAYNYTEKFIKLRPANKNVEYMYYLRSLTLNKQSSDYLREQSITEKAQRSFRELLVRFPNSRYSNDATIKLNHITNKLSAHDMAIIRFYEKQRLYLAALNVTRETLAKYPNSPYAPEAAFREIELLTILELYEIRESQYSKMRTKYPDSSWTVAAKKLITGSNL